MKKLIALAVAAASVPAMAAVTISGTTEVSYSDKDATLAANTGLSVDQAATTTLATEKVAINVNASGELDNGMTISTGITLWNSGNALNNDGGEGAITIAGSFGSLSVGDVAGPLDALDGPAVATAENDLAANLGNDMSLRYDLPELVEGLTLHVGMSAENGGDAGVQSDATGFGASYSVAGFSVFAGTETATAAATIQDDATPTAVEVTDQNKSDYDVTGYGVAYSVAGFTVGYNASEKEYDDATRQAAQGTELDGFSVGYTTGNLSLALNTTDTEVANVVTEEAQTVSASYNLGGGASVYAASTSYDKKTAADENTVGISFSF